MPILTPHEGALILELQLLIARAAQKDSLAWWDDESLTQAGAFVVDKLFPFSPGEISRKLALTAALARHRSTFAEDKRILHLYALDIEGHTQFVLRNLSLDTLSVSLEPIPSISKLEQALSTLLGEARPSIDFLNEFSGHRLELKHDSVNHSGFKRAKILAWAYLEGKLGEPVFPFIRV